eukprot:7380108-Prymnesium_polylepis.1
MRARVRGSGGGRRPWRRRLARRPLTCHKTQKKNRLELKERPELQAVGLAGSPAARVDAGAL